MIHIALLVFIVLFCFCLLLCFLCCCFFACQDTGISQIRYLDKDSILKDIKKSFFIDAKCKEMQDIKYAVEKYLWLICNELKFPYTIKKVILGGSVCENTRLWDFKIKPFTAENNKPFVEFDFLAVMHMNDIQFAEGCRGYMLVTEKKKLSDRQYHVDRGNVEARNLLFIFASSMKDIVDANIFQEIISTPSGNLSLDRSKGSPVQSAYTIWFNWESKVQNITPPDINEQKWEIFGVHVDFLPAIEFEHDDVITTDADKGWAETQDFDCSRFLVPKTCPRGHYSCWKVSTMLEEQQMIKKASRVHLEAYMFLKFFLTFAEKEGVVPATSYMMKTVFLYHLSDNKCPPSGESVQDCLSALFKSLSTMLKNDDIPHYFFKYNLLDRASNSRTPELLTHPGYRVDSIDGEFRTLYCVNVNNQYTLRCLLEEMTKRFEYN